MRRARAGLFALFCIGLTLFGLYKIEINTPNTGKGKALIEIGAGESVASVAKKLTAADVIKSPFLFKLESRISGADLKIRAGEYFLSRNASVVETLLRLTEGKTVLRPVTIPEGLTIRQIAAHLTKLDVLPPGKFASIANDPSFVRSFNIPGSSAEGYLFPDTYYLQKGATAREIVTLMINTFFEKVSKTIPREIMLDPGKLNSIITLASLIEKETGAEHERKMISAVFTNRLKKGILLQCDPTVIYALPDFDGNLRKKDLLYDSPYNTYKYRGLPPGPISNPGLASIDAAINPEATDYLYFVAKNNGEHHFSRTLKEHNRAVNKYQLRKTR